MVGNDDNPACGGDTLYVFLFSLIGEIEVVKGLVDKFIAADAWMIFFEVDKFFFMQNGAQYANGRFEKEFPGYSGFRENRGNKLFDVDHFLAILPRKANFAILGPVVDSLVKIAW